MDVFSIFCCTFTVFINFVLVWKYVILGKDFTIITSFGLLNTESLDYADLIVL